MENILPRIRLISLCIFLGGVVLAEEEYSPIRAHVQIVSGELKAVLVEKRLVFSDTWWPTELDSRTVSSAEIPQELFVRASTWLRTMIKAEWLPGDPNAWMIGVQKEDPRKGDYLILIYRIG